MDSLDSRLFYRLPFHQQSLPQVSTKKSQQKRLPIIVPSISQNYKFHNPTGKAREQQQSSLSFDAVQQDSKIIKFAKRSRYKSGNIFKAVNAASNLAQSKKKRQKLYTFNNEINRPSFISNQNQISKLSLSRQDSLKPVSIYTPLLPRRHIRRHHTQSKASKRAYVNDQKEQLQPQITPMYHLPFQNKFQFRELGIQAHHVKIGKIKRQILDKKIIKTQVNITKIRVKLNKVFNSILFTIYLQRYWKRMKQMKQVYVTNLSHSLLSDKFSQLKTYFVQGFSKFKSIIIYNYDINLNLTEKDSAKLKQKKKMLVINLLANAIEDITRSIKQMIQNNFHIDLLYHICMHGSFMCGWKIHSKQELDRMCLSGAEGYIRSDKYLEMSAIISFLLIKIIVFKILLYPESLKFNLDSNVNRQKLFTNVKLIGNILYRLLRDIQNELLAKYDRSYELGNWKHLLRKFRFQASQSLTITKGVYQQNELISGLIDKIYLNDIYHISSMKQQMTRLFKSVTLLREEMIIIHKKMRKKCY